MAGRRRALFICYYFPPLSTSGTFRSAAFASRLPSLGWDPVVLTVRNSRDRTLSNREAAIPGVRVVRTPELDLAGVVNGLQAAANLPFKHFGRPLQRNWFRVLLCIPDDQAAWLTTLAGVHLGRSVDLIYASCSPFSSAVSAALIGRSLGKPLVIDFRDAWSLNPHLRPPRVQRWVVNRLERFVVRACDRLILNTPGAERVYRAKYPEFGRKFVTIPNGYDQLTPVAALPDGTDFRILHVGEFYGSRSPRLLLQALVELNDQRLVFVHIGPPVPEFDEFAGRVRIELIPPVPRAVALEHMKGASLLYLKQGHEEGVTEYIAVAAKTYEYLATGLPILADCPQGDNADLVARYSPQSEVITSGRVEDLKAGLRRAFDRRHSSKPVIDEAFAMGFSRAALTGRLAAVFDEVLTETAR